MDKIRLDLETHTYWLGERRVPGFSEIIRDLGIVKDNPYWTDAGREEGKILHQWLLFLAQKKAYSIPPVQSIAGRVEGIRKFLSESKFKLLFGEIPQYDPVSRFACTPDLVGHLGSTLVNIDAKRGEAQPWHILQLAAQKIALAAGGVLIQRSFGLYLRDGDYRLIGRDVSAYEAKWRTICASYPTIKELRGENGN